MDTHDEHDAFVNLREEFLEKAIAAYSNVPSSLAVPLCASTQAYGPTVKVRTRSHQCELVRTNTSNPPPGGFWVVHAHCPNQSQQHQIHTSIIVEPHNLDNPQSDSTRIPRRMPQPLGQRGHMLPQPEPSHSKRPHEMASSRHSKHHRTATTIAPIRQTGSNRTSRPD